MPGGGRRYSRLGLIDKIKDGRVYQKSGSSQDGRVIYLRCQNRTICQGTAKLLNNTLIVHLHPHSEFCRPDPQKEFIAQFKQALADSLSQHWYRLRPLYDSLAAVHPEAAELTSFPSVQSFMKKCRRRRYPPCPANISEFVDRLSSAQNSRNLEYSTGRLSVNLIVDGNGAQHAIFFDEDFVQQEMHDVSKLLVDGTFRARPRIEGAYQLLTVMGIKLNHGFPFVWVVMSQKTQIAYVAVLQFIKDHVIPAANVQLVMTDFERALRNAIVTVFTTAHSTGCNTHYDRAIYRKARSLGLQRIIQSDDHAKKFFKKVLALAYLPAEFIEAQYDILYRNLTPPLMARFRQFHGYFSRYWLQTVTPAGFSVFGLSRRTNNIIESYHSRLGHRMETRPGPWDFVCKLLKLQSDVKSDIHRLRNNGQISRHARYSTVFKQNQLVRAWRELHMLEITPEEFLEKAASLKGNIDYAIGQQEQEEPEDQADDTSNEPPVVIPIDRDPDYDREIFDEQPPHWLLDNVPVAAEAMENDAESEASSGRDVEDVEQIDDVPLPQNLMEFDEARPLGDIDEVILPVDGVPIAEDENVAPQLDNNENWNVQNNAASVMQEFRRGFQQPAGLIQPAPTQKQKRNKRRKEMRRKAMARRREGAERQTDRPGLQNNIEELQGRLREAELELQVAEENVSCKVCYQTRATHAFWECGHQCICASCLERLWAIQDEYRCPLCRTLAVEPPRRIWNGD